MDSGASALAPLLDGSTAGELIPELVRHGLQQLIGPRPREWWKFPGDLNPGVAGVERTPH